MALTVGSPLSGRVAPLSEVDDDVFADEIMGPGAAVHPESSEVLAPVSGNLAKLFPGGHGLAIETPEGVQVLVHVGLETVKLKGDGFELLATEGDDVEAGTPLVRVDLDRLAELEIDIITPVVIISEHPTSTVAGERVEAGEALLEVEVESA
ncbi:MAG: PTS sugar transporter subunit IIA [Egibacteraceae bacterium]